VQAQLDQQIAATLAATQAAQINAQALGVFQGWGVDGAGPVTGASVVQHFSMMVPPTDPGQLRAVGDAAAAGFSYQPSVGSSRTRLGL
jgi:hypothetical protein